MLAAAGGEAIYNVDVCYCLLSYFLCLLSPLSLPLSLSLPSHSLSHSLSPLESFYLLPFFLGVDHEELVKLAENNFGQLSSGPSNLPQPTPCRFTGSEVCTSYFSFTTIDLYDCWFCTWPLFLHALSKIVLFFSRCVLEMMTCHMLIWFWQLKDVVGLIQIIFL